MPRTGRPKTANPRDKSLNLRLKESELRRIEDCADKLKKTRTDTLMYGIELIERSFGK